jgi:uncharacterized membrane protein (Fun14 family)
MLHALGRFIRQRRVQVLMVLPPSLSLTFSAAVIVPIILGFIIGLIVKKVLKIGLLVAILVLVLIAIGVLAPDQVLTPIVSLARSGPSLTSKVGQIAGYLPYSSITFLIGLAAGFYKG